MKASDFDILIPEPQLETFLNTRWGAVTQESPLRVKLDGDSHALEVTPATLVPYLDVGDRVLTLLSGRQAIIVGVMGGPKDKPGTIKMTASPYLPSGGWLWCNGPELSRATYARLFAEIGTIYGAGNGTTTFMGPDLSGRVPVGRNGSISHFASLGNWGGEVDHQLKYGEMPKHGHRVYSQGTYGTGVSALGPEMKWELLGGSTDGNNWTSDEGNNEYHNNLQPYLTINYIIKT